MNSPLKSRIIVFMPSSRRGRVGSCSLSISASVSQRARPILNWKRNALDATITPPPTPTSAQPSAYGDLSSLYTLNRGSDSREPFFGGL